DVKVGDQFVMRLINMALSDPSPVVRLYVASAMQHLSVKDRWAIAKALIAHGEDSEDHNLPLMYWYGIEPLVEADPQRAIEMIQECKIESITRFILPRGA